MDDFKPKDDTYPFARNGGASNSGTREGERENQTGLGSRFDAHEQPDIEGMHAAEEQKQRMRSSEDFHRMSLETLDDMIREENKIVQQRYYKDKQGVQRLYLQIREMLGFGHDYQQKNQLGILRAVVARVDGILGVLNEHRSTYANELKQTYARTVSDRKELGLNKKIIDEKEKLAQQYSMEVRSLESESLLGDGSTTRELELQCKLVDIESDLHLLNNESDEVAIRLMHADEIIGSYKGAQQGLNNMLRDFVRQRGNLQAYLNKAELVHKIQGIGGGDSIRAIYLGAAREVKRMDEILGEGTQDPFTMLPSAGRISPPTYGALPSGENRPSMPIWKSYWYERVEKRKKEQ